MAGLIPQDFIDDLLNRTDLVEVVGERLTLKKSGRNYTACCPFHQEKTPSFSVSPDKQFYYCFGCGAGGNALGFVMDHDHLAFPEAVDVLAHRAGMEVPRERSASNKPRQPSQSPLFDVLQTASDFYCHALRSHPARQPAVNYLKARGLSGSIARDFLLGYAPPGWDNLRRHFDGDPLQEKHLLDAGLLAESEESQRRYDRFRDRIIFPIRDTRGRIIGFGGRVLGDDKPKYLNSPETPVFHKSQELYGLFEARTFNRQLQEVLVVEGYMDVIALAQQGLRNAVATLGTATSSEHIKRLFRLVPTITFCFDGDNAGRKAAWRALESTLPQLKDGVKARFLFLPDGLDPDDLVRQEGAEAFQARLNQQAVSLGDYFFQHFCDDLDLDSMEGKAHLATLAAPLLEQIPSLALRTLMQQKLTQLTGLASAAAPAPTPAATASPPEAAGITAPDPLYYADDFIDFPEPPAQFRANTYSSHRHSRSPNQQLAKAVETPHLVALRSLLHQPELAHKVESAHNFAEEDDLHAQLLVSLLEALQKTPQLGALQLIARWHGTEQGRLLRTLAEKEWLIHADNLEQQFIDTINRLADQQRERSIQQLINKARAQPLSDDEKLQLNDLLMKKHRTSLATD